jgi:hypothetical protein
MKQENIVGQKINKDLMSFCLAHIENIAPGIKIQPMNI